MKPEVEEDHQPFLGFRDDPSKRDSADDEERGGNPSPQERQLARKTSRTRRYLRDLLVFLSTSLLWVIAFSVMPGPDVPPCEAAASVLSPSPSPTLPMVQVGQDGKAGTTTPTPNPDYIALTHNVTTGATLVSCGNSSQEARKNGCKYDTLLNHWVPEQCYDKEFELEYMEDDTWYAYSDQNLTKRLTRDDMGDQDAYYTSIPDHINHCSMLWKKQFWTIFEDRRVFDAVVVNPFHTEHCADFLKDIVGSGRTEPTFVKVGFSGCWVKKGTGLIPS
ncbi:hypothetical protein CMUS01_12576 [Colletotrichum musicola]|uniref:Uncharacterized protein n=1 Tax=Colletotrichum musicola TaxID=2175873 RepID=A0A8H6N0B7_9PEZI|nr:hypothetical protein CMUS01_12576 [Colletotrichum musicola]